MIQNSRNTINILEQAVQNGIKRFNNTPIYVQDFQRTVKIFDVTLRDGIQNLRTNTPVFSPKMKMDIIDKLISANIQQIEFGSNVSKQNIQMRNTQELVSSFDKINSNNKLQLCLLVPNYKKCIETFKWEGANRINKYSLITACSEGFINENTKMTFNQNLNQIDKILSNTNNKFRLYVSCCFGCPFEGPTTPTHLDNLNKIIEKYATESNVDEIVLSDTIGTYDMSQLDYYIESYKSTRKISLHIHSTENDPNIETIIRKYFSDLISIDTSIGNIGGCPSVEKSKVKPNLSTLTVANIINNIEEKQIYDIDKIAKLEKFVQCAMCNVQLKPRIKN